MPSKASLTLLEKKVRINFGRHYDQAVTMVLAERKSDPRRVFFLRSSSLPYCGVRRLLSFPQYLEQGAQSHMGPEMLYYVTVGKAIHRVFQELIGKQGDLIGNWRCPKCKSVRTFSTYTRCKACDIPRQYNELEVKFKKTLLGHVDGLFYDAETKTYWVIDYKSTSTQKIWKQNKTRDEFPYRSNIAQITSYVPLLERIYDIKISGYMLIYLSRDNPMTNKVVSIKAMSDKSKANQYTRLKEYVKTWRKMLLVQTLDEFKVLYERKLCSTPEEYHSKYRNEHEECPHLTYCFKPESMLKVAGKVLTSHPFPMLSHAPTKIRQELGLTTE